MPNGVVNNPKVFISIAGDGTVSIVAARAEMGNGAARTALPMMLADELDADWARVRVVQSPGDERTYGNQDTDGSRSVRHWIQPMRQCGAAMRAMLETAAATQWKVDVGEVQAQLHEVVHKPTGRKLGYGELAGGGGRPAGARRRQGQAEGRQRLPLHRQGQRAHRRHRRHHHRQGHLRPGRDAARHEVRGDRAAAGGWRQGRLRRLQRGHEGAGRGEDRDAAPARPRPTSSGRSAAWPSSPSNTWAAIKGREALKITWDNGPNATHDSKAYRAQLEAAVKKPGKVERNVGDADKALASAAQGDHGRVLRAAPAPRHHGAAGGGGPHEPWQVGDLGAGPEPRPGARRHRRRARRGARRDDGAADAARRRLRPQVQVRLRHRGGAAVQGAGRHAGEGGVDARGRRAPRLLPHRDRGALRGGPRRQQQGDRLAASQRGARPSSPPSRPIRSIPSTSSSAWAGWTRPSTCPTSAWRAARRRATCASAGSARSTTWRTPGRSSRSWPRSPSQLGKDPKDFLLELIGPARIVDPRKQVTTPWWNYGEPFETYPDRHGAAAARHRAGRQGSGLGQDSCRRGRGSASPRTAASSPTWRPSCTWWSATRARSPSRASIRPSTAATACIPSGCARRSRARR